MAKRLLLVDGSALIFRSYYAFIRNPLRTSRGEETSVAFGVANTLLKLLREKKPDYVAFVIDTGKPTFRHEIYPEYKANRAAAPPELIEQIPRAIELVEALSVPVLSGEGFEADDLIGTLALRAAEAGIEAEIYSGDKDFLQLVRPGVSVTVPSKDEDRSVADDAAVEDRSGVPARLIVDLMALSGDTSDNVPGVPGVGPKTAAKLLIAHGSLETILEHPERIPGKLGEKIRAHLDDVRLSRELVTIRTDAPVGAALEDLERREIDASRAAPLFREFEFHRLLDEIGSPPEERSTRYALAADREDLERIAESLRGAGRFAFDTETTSVEPMRAELVGISLARHAGEAWYVPVRHAGEGNIPLETVREILGPLLADASLPKTAQNAKYDAIVLEKEGMPVKGIAFDPMIASYLLDPGQRQHGLDHLALIQLNHKMIPIDRVIGSGRAQTTMDRVTAEEARDYACEDADFALRLAERFGPMLEETGLTTLFRDVEIPLSDVLRRMEMTGVALDVPFLEGMGREMAEEIAGMEEAIHRLAGEPFNLNSPKQLQKILFEKLGLKPVKKTKTGFSTDTEVLQELAPMHPLPAKLLEYRQVEKLRSTYVDALPKMVHPETGRIHTSFNQTVTATGRLSSSDPNLQNIPIRTAPGRKIRRAFIAGGSDRIILSLDYSQIELRILAHFSGDEALIRDFREGTDIHRRTAATLFGLDESEVSGEMRSRAKAVNFGILYGMGAFGLATRLGIGRGEAQDFIDDYFRAYPLVKGWLERTVAEARERGWVETILGRRRNLPDMNDRNARIRAFAERTAVNTPIQGSAADLIKLAMIEIDRALLRKKMETRMILQVHDELVFEAPDGEREEATGLARRIMESRMELLVPLTVDAGAGRNWLEAHGMEGAS
ncbi:MAG: DNA polymerase I [Candidatus Eisenbacteria bacterium]|nr:DNA polymerase I [Candidatus Eisenbacteria bacterium]